MCAGKSQNYGAGYSATAYLRQYYVANIRRRLESCGLRLLEKPRDVEGVDGIYVYDAAFRQQISFIEKADFSKINQSLYSSTFLAYTGRRLYR